MHSIDISLLILYTLAALCFLGLVAICLILWRDDPIDNDYETPVKDLPSEPTKSKNSFIIKTPYDWKGGGKRDL